MTGIYTFDDFELDVGKLELTRAGRHAHVNALTLRLLGVLVASAGHIVTKQELLERVWDGRRVSHNVITVAMARLRRALGYTQGERDLVVNVHGRGYRFAREVVRRDLVEAHSIDPPSERTAPAPFVGRESVLGHLRAALKQASEGNGGVVLLTGEPGIGKTRMAEVFGREARELGLPVAWGYCREVGDTPPLWPFASLLREVIAQVSLDLSDRRLAGQLPQLARLLPELAIAERWVGTEELAADGGGFNCKHRIFDAITRTLTLAAEKMPCVLVLDDLHRADPASLELLNYFIDEMPRTRLLLVAGLRNKFGRVRETLARVLGHRNTTRIALPPLSEAHVGAYLEAVLGSASAELSRSVFARSEGNPFFVTELARQWRLTEHCDPNSIRIPEAALDVVRQRVAGFDEVARGALSVAAVIGRNFTLPVLQAVTGVEGPALVASLDAAIASDVVIAKRDSLTEYVFGHELLRAVLYDALPPAERRTCHLRVAQALEQRAAKGDAVPPADLAYHSRSALPLGDLRQTIRHCMNASIAAAHVFAYGDAARCLQHALETLDMLEKPSPKMRIQLLLHQALLTRAQSTRAFQPLIARVAQLAREHNFANPLARAAMLHDPYPGFPPLPGSVQAFEAALCLLEASDGERVLRATMLARLAASAPLAFDAAASGAQLEAAEAIARESPEMLDQFSVRAARLYLTGGPAQPEQTARELRDLHDYCRQHAFVLSVPPVMLELHAALAALQGGDLGAMNAALERAIERCRTLDTEILWFFERFLVLARFNAGERVEARGALTALHVRAREQAIYDSELFCAYDEVLLFGQSAARTPQFLGVFAAADNDRPNIWSLKLRALQAAGCADDARARLSYVPPDRLASLPCDRDYLGTLGALARVAVELGAVEYAEAIYPLLAPYPEHFAVHVSFLSEGSVSQLLGMLSRVLGRREQAREHLQTALIVSERAGLVLNAQDARRELEAMEL